ncbi:hypothetical protein [Shewanella algae]|uniref:hypothetical protein n=1 Tax=Shewanella algae TaxID=38313 RepID=UPI00313D9782
MWYLLLILTMTLGSLLIYLGSKHQALLANPLPWQAKLLGTLLLLLALLGWGLLLTASAALFFWLMLLSMLLGSLPFISLLKGDNR